MLSATARRTETKATDWTSGRSLTRIRPSILDITFVETPTAPAVEGALSPGARGAAAGAAPSVGAAAGLAGPLALAFSALSAGLLFGFPRTAVRDAAFGGAERAALSGGEVALACAAALLSA